MVSALTPTDWGLLIVFFLATFFQFELGQKWKKWLYNCTVIKKYRLLKTVIYFIKLVYVLVSSLLAVGVFLLARNFGDGDMWQAAMSLYVAMMVLDKMWHVAFYKEAWLWLAFILVFIELCVSIAFVVLSGLLSSWWTLGFSIPYVIWLFVVCWFKLSFAWRCDTNPIRELVDLKRGLSQTTGGVMRTNGPRKGNGY